MKTRIIMAGAGVLGAATIGLSSAAMASAQSTGAAKHGTDHHIHWSARLNQAERDGTITSAQKTAFKAELKNLRAERRSALSKSSTTADRTAERAKLKSELQSWASTNNFPLSKIAPKIAG